MKLLTVTAALLHLAMAGHVQVKMPYLNSAGVSYVQSHEQYSVPSGYEASYHLPQQVAYEAQNFAYHAQAPIQYSGHQEYYGQQQLAYAQAPAAVGYAHVPVKAAVAVPTVHHVPAVADVPYTKIEAQPAVLQKLVDYAKPAVKTRKYEIRRPAIQKQFYDIEERTVVRPVGSALVELDEPLSKSQKGPAVITSLEDHHHHVEQPIAYSAHHEVAVTAAPVAHVVAVTQPTHTVAITPASHGHIVSTYAAPHHEYAAPGQSYEHAIQAHSYEHAIPAQSYEHQYIHQEPVAIQDDHYYVASTPAPAHYSTPVAIVSSTPGPHFESEDSIIVNAAARNLAAAEHVAHEAHVAHGEAVARANFNAHHGVHSHSNGAPHEHVVVNEASHVNLKSLNHLSHEQAQENQQNLIKLLTAKGGVAEVGFGRSGHAEHVGDAGISRARVLSATPSPYHEPVEEKTNTRRIVVSRPVHTLQEIDVVEPATKIERVAVKVPTVIKTAKVGYERVHTSVPVYGKALAPAIAHAQVPVEYYHHNY